MVESFKNQFSKEFTGDVNIHDIESILNAAIEGEWQSQQNLAETETLGQFSDDEMNPISNAIKE